MSQPGVCVVLVTAPTPKVATRLARTLVEEGLAACVNIVPRVRSLYRWKGKVVDEPEVLLLVKTRRSAFAALQARITALHPYEVPEVIALDVARGSAPYLDWVKKGVSAPRRAPARREPSAARRAGRS